MTPGFLLLFIFLVLINANTEGQSFSFQKINSGTKADIHAILKDDQQNIYFLTDKIYMLDKDARKKLDFPVEGKIYGFYPATPQDIWFTVIPFTSTCMLYHFHDGITEHIRPPFANYITAMHFFSVKSALIASIADMAVYENGSIHFRDGTLLTGLAACNQIKNIYDKLQVYSRAQVVVRAFKEKLI